MTKKNVKAPVLRRVASVDEGAIDEANRTVKVAFASEIPYQRAFGYEVLNVEAGSIDTDYLDNGAAVLVNHDWEDLVGVVTEYSIDADRIARATVKFGRSPRAQEIFQDVVDGIRRGISFGYMVKAMTQEDPIDGVPVFRVNLFQPFEVSFVSVPADSVGAGVGKSLATRDIEIEVQPIEDFIKSMGESEEDDEEETKDADQEEGQAAEETEAKAAPETEEPQADAAETPADEDAEAVEQGADSEETDEEEQTASEVPAEDEKRSAVIQVSQNDPRLEAEAARVKTLQELGEKLRAVDIAAQCIKDGGDIEQFKQLVIQSKSSKGNKMELGLNKQEVQRFSTLKAMLAQATGKWEDAGFEREVCQAAAQLVAQEGRTARGLAIPLDILQRNLNSASSATAGGNLIQTNVDGANFIDTLYHAYVLPALGTTLMSSTSPFSLPKINRDDTAGFVGENAVAPSGSFAVEQVPFAPRRVADSTQLSKRLLNQTQSFDAEAWVMNNFARRIALAIQKDALAVIRARGGVKHIAFADVAPTRNEIIDMEAAIEAGDSFGKAFLVNAVTKGSLKKQPIAANYPAFLLQGTEMEGYPVAVTNAMPNGEVMFADFSALVTNYFSMLDIVVNPYTFATSNIVEVSVGMDVDNNLTRDEVFAIGKKSA